MFPKRLVVSSELNCALHKFGYKNRCAKMQKEKLVSTSFTLHNFDGRLCVYICEFNRAQIWVSWIFRRSALLSFGCQIINTFSGWKLQGKTNARTAKNFNWPYRRFQFLFLHVTFAERLFWRKYLFHCCWNKGNN